MIKVAFDFTRSGNFAVWEGGSLNPQTNKGWACLVADTEGNPRQPIYERDPQHSKHHYLIRVSSGYLVVVTNFKPLPNSRLFSVKVDVGRIQALSTASNEENGKREVQAEIETLCPGSFLSEFDNIVKQGRNLNITIPGASAEVVARVREMVVTALEKATTISSEQRMFWCVKREQPAKKPRKHASAEKTSQDLPKEALQEQSSEQEAELEQAPEFFETEASNESTEPCESEEVHDGSIDENAASIVGLIGN